MPHMMIEYSPGLDAEIASMCHAIHRAMVATGIFPLAGIRVRAHRCDYAVIADDDDRNQFAALTLSVGAGRERDVIQEAGDRIFEAARSVLPDRLSAPFFALSLEIRIIDPDFSWKETPIHSRLSSVGKR